MDRKVNCWEHRRCGREPGGARAAELGVCPAAVEGRLDGVHGGLNGGRACWAVEGTSCHKTLGAKFNDCLRCTFFGQVQEEEGRDFQLMAALRARLR
ncbi:MAG: hypothetical protein D6739_12470 [Nitrospirae bacterium]|nr:MAG: hypothetical protein D6739_12470 [Nitrospirota bacterium]